MFNRTTQGGPRRVKSTRWVSDAFWSMPWDVMRHKVAKPYAAASSAITNGHLRTTAQLHNLEALGLGGSGGDSGGNRNTIHHPSVGSSSRPEPSGVAVALQQDTTGYPPLSKSVCVCVRMLVLII